MVINRWGFPGDCGPPSPGRVHHAAPSAHPEIREHRRHGLRHADRRNRALSVLPDMERSIRRGCPLPSGLAAIVIFGTVLPFTIYMVGVKLCGPVKPACWPASNRCLPQCSWFSWLGESFFNLWTSSGFSLIAVTVFLLSKKKKTANLPSKKQSNSAVFTD